MRASRVSVVPKEAVNMNGVKRSARRQLAANVETKRLENGKKKEPSSPVNNSENISPVTKKLRREGKKEEAVVDKTASPRGKNGVRGTKIDKNYVSSSPLETSATQRQAATEKQEEVNLIETQADANKSLNENLITPNTSLASEKKEAEKSDRQLRSSGRKAPSPLDTPVRRNKSVENISFNNSVDTPHSASKADVDVEANKSLGTPGRKRKANKNVQESEPVDTPVENNFENETFGSNLIDESVVVTTTLETLSESEQNMHADISIAEIVAKREQSENPTEIKEEDQTDIFDNKQTDEDVSAKLIDHETNAQPVEVVEEKTIDQEQPAAPVSEIEVPQVKEENSPTTTASSAHNLTIDNIKSPSTASVDSAKGSSIGTEVEFIIGDLFWGQIHHFCYWPCMVCPDDTDPEKSITRLIEQQTEVHVRFFADNARHSWVKRENLLRYLGLKQYKELTNEVKEKYGENSPKCKIFFPKRSKKNVWRGAVKEADDMVAVPYEERLETFFKLNDIARERIKEEKMRRKSFSSAKSNPNISLTSTLDTSDSSDTTKKRNRSESPASPEFSPMKSEHKRRKTTSSTERPTFMQSNSNELVNWKQNAQTTTSSSYTQMQSQQQQQPQPNRNDEQFNSPEFEGLYNILKDYMTSGFQCDPMIEAGIYRSVRNVWAMKQLINSKIVESGAESVSRNLPSKRLSSRLMDLEQRQHMKAVMATVSTSPLQVTYPVPEKRRNSIGLKPKNRPMSEVIDDIFNLDKFYLFDNVRGRKPVCKYCFKPNGVLRRCSKGCLSWLHADCSNVEDDDVADDTVDKKSKQKKRLSQRSNSTESSSIVHVTADDETNESDEDKQKSETPVAAVVFDLETSDALETLKEEELAVCKECANDVKPQCFVCKNEKFIKSTATEAATNELPLEKEALHMCNMTNCGRAYHLSCLRYWPQAKTVLGKNSVVSLRCPSHLCHTCVSDDPKGKFQHLKDTNTIKCVKCPATYHMDSTCIPAGSNVLTAAHIICPRHGIAKADQDVNVNWCFICVRGGKLICCETCPTAVHAECTNAQLEPNENYICDECESGRLPLYGEMVWAKFIAYRWWPAIILPPTEVPLNIRNKPHGPFDFVIRFFGTHDHGWISRRRVYLYVEGDWSEPPKSKRQIDQSYLRGVREAKEAYEIIKAKTLMRDTKNENKERLHPHPYVKIRVNRAVPPVKLHQDIEMASKCNCDPNEENPCGLDSNCLNRVLYHECNPKVCPAGERCQNQMFESRISPALEIFYAKRERGFGLRSREAISAGTFIIEYVGEVINRKEFQRRMEQKTADRDENFYFLHVEKDYIIDAGPKGNVARFMNHSCDPNCETQKWSVNGLNRVGLFAIKDIPAKTELTFNYHWDELLGNDKKICCCGSANCTGQIGKISKEDIKRKAELETTALSASKKTKISKQRSSLPKKVKGNNQKGSQQTTASNRKQKNTSLPLKRRSSLPLPNSKEKVEESNDNNNNV